MSEQNAKNCCADLPEIFVEEVSQTSLVKKFDLIARSVPYWWLAAAKCTECGQHWFIGEESRLNDLYIARKVTVYQIERATKQNDWPYLNYYEELLIIGKHHGHFFRYMSEKDPAFLALIDDLRMNRPGISQQEIEFLTNSKPTG